MTLRESILFSILAVLLIIAILCPAIAAPVPPKAKKVIELSLVYRSPNLVILQQCGRSHKKHYRILQRGNQKMIINKEACYAA